MSVLVDQIDHGVGLSVYLPSIFLLLFLPSYSLFFKFWQFVILQNIDILLQFLLFFLRNILDVTVHSWCRCFVCIHLEHPVSLHVLQKCSTNLFPCFRQLESGTPSAPVLCVATFFMWCMYRVSLPLENTRHCYIYFRFNYIHCR